MTVAIALITSNHGVKAQTSNTQCKITDDLYWKSDSGNWASGSSWPTTPYISRYHTTWTGVTPQTF